MNRLTMGSPARDRIAHETDLTCLTLPTDPQRFSSATLCDTTAKISFSPRGVNYTPMPIGSGMPITKQIWSGTSAPYARPPMDTSCSRAAGECS